MPDLTLDLRFLRYAILVAEHGSFRRAADTLSISQSTVSRRIRLLEHRLGISIFERSRSGARLTHAGERFIRDAAIGAGHLHRAVRDLHSAQRGYREELRIGLIASFAGGFLADLLCCFRSRYPNVDVKLEEATSQSNIDGILSGRLDAAFVLGTPQLSGSHARVLWDERIFLALPSAHGLATRKDITWEEVREETFLVSADGPGQEIEDQLGQMLCGLKFRPKMLVQKIGRENLLNMVAMGFGLTLATRSMMGASCVDLTFVPIGDHDYFVTTSVIWPSDSQNPVLNKLLELCDQLAAKRDERTS